MNGKCPDCRRDVDIFDAVWDPRRRRYCHSACVEVKLMTRLEELKKKAQRETMTMEEAHEADELTLELNGLREINKQLEGKGVDLLRKALTSPAVVFRREDPRFIDVGAVSARLRSGSAIMVRQEEGGAE